MTVVAGKPVISMHRTDHGCDRPSELISSTFGETRCTRRYHRRMPRPPRMLRTLDRKWREVRMVARGFQSAGHPLLAQIVPIRRCNLACTYCNEYDKHSAPVALATMRSRIDHLARLRTANIEISGGEPLL